MIYEKVGDAYAPQSEVSENPYPSQHMSANLRMDNLRNVVFRYSELERAIGNLSICSEVKNQVMLWVNKHTELTLLQLVQG